MDKCNEDDDMEKLARSVKTFMYDLELGPPLWCFPSPYLLVVPLSRRPGVSSDILGARVGRHEHANARGELQQRLPSSDRFYFHSALFVLVHSHVAGRFFFALKHPCCPTAYPRQTRNGA